MDYPDLSTSYRVWLDYTRINQGLFSIYSSSLGVKQLYTVCLTYSFREESLGRESMVSS